MAETFSVQYEDNSRTTHKQTCLSLHRILLVKLYGEKVSTWVFRSQRVERFLRGGMEVVVRGQPCFSSQVVAE